MNRYGGYGAGISGEIWEEDQRRRLGASLGMFGNTVSALSFSITFNRCVFLPLIFDT